ncbi:hypothetical protein AAHS21_31650, partial [Mycobacterium sp. 050272]|uniref:hypothetical protein n=1 Tax=Mycobacterium sp. 050272 TaxID=3142488 RepID=UPI00319C8032
NHPTDTALRRRSASRNGGRLKHADPQVLTIPPATIDEADANDGAEVTVVWGDEASIPYKPRVEAHKETTIRATVNTTAPA